MIPVSAHLSRTLEKLGGFVARYPKWVIALSVASSLLLGLGMVKTSLRTDLDHVFAPYDCRANEEERVIEELFPMNSSYNFDYLRKNNRGRFAAATLSSKDEQTVLRKSVFTEVAAFDEMVRSIEVEWKGSFYRYIDICARNRGKCYRNQALDYLDNISQIEAKEISLKYPFQFDISGMNMNTTGNIFGGVKTDGLRNLLEAKILRLFYFLDDSNEEVNDISLQWERAFKELVSGYDSRLLTIMDHVSSEYELLSKRYILQGFFFGCLAFAVIVTFCVLNSMTSDWVSSKPFLSVAGCLSPLLAALGSTGLTAAIGVKFSSLNIAIACLVLGVGVDDMFILIAAWRKTNSEDTVVKRLEDAYSHAAVPIVTSSLTNFIAFSVGATIPVPGIRAFCIHSAIAVALDFIYQVTLFGGCMALDGYREERRLHPITLRPVVPTGEAGKGNKVKLSLPTWFIDKLGHWISKRTTIITIIILFILYLVGASFGSAFSRSGLQYRDLFFYDSKEYKFLKNMDDYFTEYAYPMQLVFNDTLDYSNRKVQRGVIKATDRFHRSRFIQKQEFNWLRVHMLFVNYNRTYCSSYNLSEPKGFINCLRNEYFSHPLGRTFRDDIKFHEDGKHIVASRFILVTKGRLKSSEQKLLIEEMRAIADSSQYSVAVQSFWWLHCEILFLIEHVAVQSIGSTLAGIFLVLVLLLSKLSSAVLVTVAIVSVEFGILGYMSLFGITINPITVAILAFSMGLSIDPCTHVSYVCQESRGTYREKVQRTLGMAGIPVLQGSVSTLLGVSCLIFIPHYNSIALVTLTALLATFSLLHAVFLIPLMHHLWDVASQFLLKSMKRTKERKRASPQSVSVISTNRTSQI